MFNITPTKAFKASTKESLSSSEYHKIIEIQQNVMEFIYADNSQQVVLEYLCQLAEEMIHTCVASIMLLNGSTGLMNLISRSSSRKNTHNIEVTGYSRELNFLSSWSVPIYNQQKILVGSFALSSLDLVPSNFHKQFLETCAFLASITYKCSAKKAEARESQEKIVYLAYHDELTGLWNRQKIILDIAQKSPTACAIFNLDDFKEINAFFGIDAADRLLKQIGEWFTEINNSPYRIAGDEFAILIYEEKSWDKIYYDLQEILSLFAEKHFVVQNESINIQMTIGVAIGENALFTRADMAMHQGKDSKNPITLYEEEKNIEEKYHSNITMSEAIRKAISDQRIICYYQPIVNLQTGSVDKYETLVRMIDENGTIVPPLAFLSIAKKTNLYPQITLEVVKQACTLFATRSEAFSINLSNSDIRNKETTQEIIRIIKKTGTAPRVVFEILESEGIENYDEVVKFITQEPLANLQIHPLI